MRDEKNCIRGVERDQRSLAQVVLAISYRHREVESEKVQNRANGCGVEYLLGLRVFAGWQCPYSARTRTEDGIQKLTVNLAPFRHEIAQIVRRLQVEKDANVPARHDEVG